MYIYPNIFPYSCYGYPPWIIYFSVEQNNPWQEQDFFFVSDYNSSRSEADQFAQSM